MIGTFVKDLFFFFFQAEDGIRDVAVTGVQTCALPISAGGARPRREAPCAVVGDAVAVVVRAVAQLDVAGPRSEERRVGKECKYWLSLSHTLIKQWFRYLSHFLRGRDSLVDIIKERRLL